MNALAQIQTITINGAGANVNGGYYQSASFSERINFTRNDGQRLIFYASGIWRITDASGWIYYSNSANTPLPPETGWIVYTGVAAAGGVEPVPTIDNMVIYVNHSASGSNDGTNWTNAYTDLQSALTAATSGHRVAVAAGTYKPTSGTDRSVSFNMKQGVELYGGYSGTETFLSERDVSLHESILSGDIGIVSNNSDNSNCIVFATFGLNSSSLLDGFTIKDANGGYSGSGGGLYLWGSPKISRCNITDNTTSNYGGGMTIRMGALVENCTFSNNTSGLNGGGVFSQGTGTFINCSFSYNTSTNGGGGNVNENNSFTNCTFSNNMSETGGGISCYGTSVFTNCMFSSNSVTSQGGAMAVLFGTSTIDGCTFLNNSATAPSGYGGGIMSMTSTVNVSNSTFTGNGTANNGGAIQYFSGGTSAITNCLIIGNSASTQQGSIAIVSPGPDACSVTLTNCTIASNAGGGLYSNCGSTGFIINNSIVWGNYNPGSTADQMLIFGDITVNHSCYGNGPGEVNVSGILTASNDNITTDPLFVGSGSHPYALLAPSSCVDAGDNSYTSQSVDIRGIGFGRKLDKTDGSVGTVDIGAYEYQFGVDPLPVEITGMTVSVLKNTVEVRWLTATELNNYGFEIERKTMDNWRMVGFVDGSGTTNAPKEYSFSDKNLQCGKYSYRLKQIDRDGKFSYSNTVEA
ncbi:MAG: right-handed parallel beta-helix repeat-containing protein, partial [Bacteroidota bacterium]